MSKGEAASRSGGLFYPADRANPKVVAMEARAQAKIASLKMNREDAPDSYDSTEEGNNKAKRSAKQQRSDLVIVFLVHCSQGSVDQSG